MNKRNMCIVGTVATMLAIAPLAARADYSSTTTTANGAVTTVTTPSATTTIVTTPNASPYTTTPITTSVYTVPTGQQTWVDYRLLTNRTFDGIDLAQARSRGLSDRQIAVAAKVARLSHVPFNDVVDAIARGETYSQIADDYGLRDSDLRHTSDEEMMIDQYRTAYDNTGEMAMTKIAGNQILLTTVSGMPMTTDQNIDQALRSSGNYTTLINALHKTRMLSTLRGPGPFTLFAPTDAAFAKLSPADMDYLMHNKDKLSIVLNYHIIPARIDAATAIAMTSPGSPATLEGSPVQVTTSNGTVMINNATVVQPDILCTNGVIHGIDTVLIPGSITLP